MSWELFRREGPDGIAMVGVDAELLADAPVTGLPIGVDITIDTPSAQPDVLAATESAIDAVTDRLGGRIAATVRTESRLSTLVYLATDEHAEQLSHIPLPGRSSISVAPANDPSWTLFDRVRPTGIEEQSMRDMAVFQQLFAAGDRGGVRRIDHVVRGLPAGKLPSFERAVASLGFELAATDVDAVDLAHDADPVDITADSWTIRQIAERHGAVYDGWGCEVVGDRNSGTQRRRWWQRRRSGP